jgi:hypothetical protein
MAMLKKAATLAVVASAGVMGTAGIASADSGDNNVGQTGVVPVEALNNVDISPNLGCLLDQTAPDAAVQGVLGLVPIGANLSHALQNAHLDVLANGNVSTNVYDNSCTSNLGSSQAGENTRGSRGAGDSTSVHETGNGAGSGNSHDGECAGGLLGGTGILGNGCPPTGTGTTTTPPGTGTTTAPPPARSTPPTGRTLTSVPMTGTHIAPVAYTGSLAHTGADVGTPLAAAGAALLGGAALRMATRRRGDVR